MRKLNDCKKRFKTTMKKPKIVPSGPPRRRWLERESKMLFKCGTITYQNINMRILISVSQTPRTYALAQVTIHPGSAPPRKWRGWMERGSKMLLKCGSIAYRTVDMQGLFSVAQTPRTSSLSQVMIRPGSSPLRLERVAREGIPHAVETRNNRRGQKTCTDCSLLLRRLRPLPSPRCPSQFPNYPSIPSPQKP